jgi:hypothetical protein
MLGDDITLVELATIAGGFATAIAALFAVIGLSLTYMQIRANRAISNEATAKNLYRQYLEDAVDRPDLVNPDLDELTRNGNLVQYELFVAHMLFSLEEILLHAADPDWRAVVKAQLKRHTEYLSSEYFAQKHEFYERPLRELIIEVGNEK